MKTVCAFGFCTSLWRWVEKVQSWPVKWHSVHGSHLPFSFQAVSTSTSPPWATCQYDSSLFSLFPCLSPSLPFFSGCQGSISAPFLRRVMGWCQVCVFGFWYEDVCCRRVSCRTKARGLSELSCFASLPVTFHWQLVSYQQTAHKLSGVLIMKISAYQSLHLFLLRSLSSVSVSSHFPYVCVCVWWVPNAPLLVKVLCSEIMYRVSLMSSINCTRPLMSFCMPASVLVNP